MQSLKNNGVNYLRDVMEAKREKDEETDGFLKKLIEEIPGVRAKIFSAFITPSADSIRAITSITFLPLQAS